MTNVIDNLQQVVSMRGTKANIAALAASLEEIVVAYATDTGEFGIYTNSGWVWIGVGSSPLTVKDEGSALATAASSLDFVGAGVVASGTGAGKTITIAGASLTVQEEGSPLATAADTLNFVGAGVTATGSGTTKTVTSLRDEPHVSYDGTVVLDGNGDPVMVLVA